MKGTAENILKEQSRKVGEDMYPHLTDNDKVIIAYGMTPKPLMDTFNAGLKARIGQLCCKEYNMQATPENVRRFASAVKPEALEAYRIGFAIGLMDGATKAGKMVC